MSETSVYWQSRITQFSMLTSVPAVETLLKVNFIETNYVLCKLFSGLQEFYFYLDVLINLFIGYLIA